MFETKVMVAPNSPIALAKARITPAMMPGKIRGKVTIRNTSGGLAPSVPAASSSLASTALDREAYAAHEEREAHHGASERRTRPAEGEDDPKRLGEKSADRPSSAEADEEQVARHHGE